MVEHAGVLLPLLPRGRLIPRWVRIPHHSPFPFFDYQQSLPTETEGLTFCAVPPSLLTMPRRRLPEEKKRSCPTFVRLRPAERRALERYAEEHSTTISSALRNFALRALGLPHA